MPNVEWDRLNNVFPVSHETLERLLVYKELLLKWQKSINLVSNSSLYDVWERHFIDSVQIAKFITSSSTIVDLGSGAGFPGLVLAILGVGEVHLVESDKKKCIFLREVSRETNANVKIHNDRIERLSIKTDIITSRACADVSQLFSWSENFVSCETKCLFHKGRNYSIEYDKAKKEWEFDSLIHPSVVDADSIILECSHIIRRSHDGNSRK